jgi:hypothetical protein
MVERGVRSCVALPPSTGRAVALRQAREQGFEWLIELTASATHGELELAGALRRSDALIWRDLLQPRRGTMRHLHARVAVDAEIRAFRVPRDSRRVVLSQQSWPFGQRQLLALHGGDLDGDRRCELVVLHRDGVAVLRPGSRPMRVVASHLFGKPLAAVTPRRAFGTLVVVQDKGGKGSRIAARSSDHGRGVELTFDGKRLKLSRQFAGYPLTRVGQPGARLVVGAPRAGMDWFARSTLGQAGEGAALPVEEGRRRWLLGLVDVEGQLQLYGGAKLATRVAQLARVGLAFDIADLDDDGALEVVTSSASEPDEADRITIWRHQGGGLKQVWRSAKLAGRIEALAHGDLDGDGDLEVFGAVAALDGRLLLVVLD